MVFCNNCGREIDEYDDGECMGCGQSGDFRIEDEDEDVTILRQAMEMNAGAFYDRMEWSG